MKKIISILLFIACLCTICSCGVKDKFNEVTGRGVDVAPFQEAIANTNPSSVIVTIETATELGELNTVLEVQYQSDTSAVIKYSYERFLPFGEGTDVKETVSGTVYRYADGTYSEDLGIDFSVIQPGISIDLAPIKKIAKVNDAKDLLTAMIPAATTEAVFGTLYTSDVYFELDIQGGTVENIEMTYDNVAVVYNYS